MGAFEEYASFYELVYRDKDYAGEARFVDGIIRKYRPAASSLLDLGCGAGAHARSFASLGYAVHGVDLSARMIAAAQRAGLERQGLTFSQGDVRNVRLGRRFDAVVLLFHVMSYQAGEGDFEAVLDTAQAHLKPGGALLFDCWYGPAVLTERPSVRVRDFEDDAVRLTRIAVPEMLPNEDTVVVRYKLIARDKGGGNIREVSEQHRLRYLFQPQVREALRTRGLQLTEVGEWMTGREPDFHSWYVYFVAQ